MPTFRAAALPVLVGLAMTLSAPASAEAATYRCDDAGKVTYSNQPCTGGHATILNGDVGEPSPEDRVAANARARADQTRLNALEHDRLQEKRQDEKAAAAALRRGGDPGRRIQACPKLAKAARRAHDDFGVAGPRDQPKARLRMQRADEDYAALCKGKP